MSPPIFVRFNGAPHRTYVQVKPIAEKDDRRPQRALILFLEGEAQELPLTGTPGEEPLPPWRALHRSAEEAIRALVAAGGPDPRDFASPRLGRRAKTVIAIALVVLFLVSALGGFVGYRVTRRAAGPAGQAAGPLVEVRGGAV